MTAFSKLQRGFLLLFCRFPIPLSSVECFSLNFQQISEDCHWLEKSGLSAGPVCLSRSPVTTYRMNGTALVWAACQRSLEMAHHITPVQIRGGAWLRWSRGSGQNPAEAAAIRARICIVMKKLISAGSISISVPGQLGLVYFLPDLITLCYGVLF